MSGLENANRIVIKIGSSLLVNGDGTINHDFLTGLSDDVAMLTEQRKQVVLVSSGSIALGRHQLGFKAGKLRLEESQASAATGQIKLAHAYQDALAKHKLTIAQILLTLDDTEERRRYLNARSTLNTLLAEGVVPIVNENDTVATSEIRYGDNDRLSARVAGMVEADCLIILSDIDGLYADDPRDNPNADHIAEIDTITDEIAAMAGGVGSSYGTGGMRTKIEAAKLATAMGASVAITSGKVTRPVKALLDGARATWFTSNQTPQAARKQWILGTLKAHGSISVDDGAATALKNGRSLLAAGVTDIDGSFAKGDAVDILDGQGKIVARGLIGYDAEDARAIMGLQSDQIAEVLGYKGRHALIHRDDLVMTDQAQQN